MSEKILDMPLNEEEIRELEVGDVVYLRGPIFTCRDMGHIEIKKAIAENRKLPVNFEGAAIYHAGPIVKENKGSWELVVIGPTSSMRMETYAQMIGQLGVRVLIGKGGMGDDTLKACSEYGLVYLQAAPGCAAVLVEGIENIDDVYWIELGVPEALWVLNARKFGPLTVGMDTHGKSIYKELNIKAKNKVKELFG